MDWRSEVEAARQMVAIHETLGMPSAAHPHRAVVAMGAALETATHERDEARAEVERLRAESEERLRTIQRVAEAVAAEPPMDLVARVRWQVAEVERLRHRLGRVIVAADQIPQHLGATWWGQRLRAALVPPATEVPDDRARGAGGAT